MRRRDLESEVSRASLREARRAVEDCEKDVARLEAKIAALTSELEDPELYTTREGTERSVKAGKELDRLRRQLDTALEKWTTATEQAESLASQRQS